MNDNWRNIWDRNPNHKARPHVMSQNEKELAEPCRLQLKVIQDAGSSGDQPITLSPTSSHSPGGSALEIRH